MKKENILGFFLCFTMKILFFIYNSNWHQVNLYLCGLPFEPVSWDNLFKKCLG